MATTRPKRSWMARDTAPRPPPPTRPAGRKLPSRATRGAGGVRGVAVRGDALGEGVEGGGGPKLGGRSPGPGAAAARARSRADVRRGRGPLAAGLARAPAGNHPTRAPEWL